MRKWRWEGGNKILAYKRHLKEGGENFGRAGRANQTGGFMAVREIAEKEQEE